MSTRLTKRIAFVDLTKTLLVEGEDVRPLKHAAELLHDRVKVVPIQTP